MIGDIALGAVAGLAAGTVFFGGLRWTLSRLASASRPLALAIGSFLLRSAVAVAFMLIAAGGGLAAIVTGLGGMLAVRTLMISRARRELEEATQWT